MSCLQCNICTYTLTSSTQLILYPIPVTNRNKAKPVMKSKKPCIEGKEKMRQGEGEEEGEEQDGEQQEQDGEIVSCFASQRELNREMQGQGQGGRFEEGVGCRGDDKENISTNRIDNIVISRLASPKSSVSHSLNLLQSQVSSHKPHKKPPSSLTSTKPPTQTSLPLSGQSSTISLYSLLLEKENLQLKDQLHRLKNIQKQLLVEQLRVRDKNNRELTHLKNRSDQIQRRSFRRAKELEQLKDMLGIVKGTSRVRNIAGDRNNLDGVCQ